MANQRNYRCDKVAMREQNGRGSHLFCSVTLTFTHFTPSHSIPLVPMKRYSHRLRTNFIISSALIIERVDSNKEMK